MDTFWSNSLATKNTTFFGVAVWKANPRLFSGKSRLVKYYNLARYIIHFTLYLDLWIVDDFFYGFDPMVFITIKQTIIW